ncbi:MAG: hypothetical protein E7402_03655 [Ruminococcaceae bacterium]|nr:hypothetical protein [Oscillospiraceae bacterium]
MEKQKESWKSKLENFWYYHKGTCLVALFVIIILSFIATNYTSRLDTDINISLVSENILSEATINFNTIFADKIEDANGDGEPLITISRLFIGRGNEDNQDELNLLEKQLANKGATLFIVDALNYERLIKKDAFCPLDEFFSVEDYGDRVCYRGDVPIAFHLGGSKVLAEMEFVTDDLYALLLFRREGEENDPAENAEYRNAVTILDALMVQE